MGGEVGIHGPAPLLTDSHGEDVPTASVEKTQREYKLDGNKDGSRAANRFAWIVHTPLKFRGHDTAKLTCASPWAAYSSTMLVLYETAMGFALFKLTDSAKLTDPNLYKEFETPESANGLCVKYFPDQGHSFTHLHIVHSFPLNAGLS